MAMATWDSLETRYLSPDDVVEGPRPRAGRRGLPIPELPGPADRRAGRVRRSRRSGRRGRPDDCALLRRDRVRRAALAWPVGERCAWARAEIGREHVGNP